MSDLLQVLPEPVRTSGPLRVLLAGNPNAGKSTLFNRLTGLRAQTANYPGVTVELRRGRLKLKAAQPRVPSEGRISSDEHDGNDEVKTIGDEIVDVEVIDLPGLYSLEAITPEEQIASRMLTLVSNGGNELIVVVIDATNMTRNLFLASQILEQNKPTVIALNFMDAAQQDGLQIDRAALEERLKCRVIPVSASTGEGFDELTSAIREFRVRSQPSLPISRESCVGGCTGCSFAARHSWGQNVTSQSVHGNARRGRLEEWLDRWLTAPLTGTFLLLAILFGVFFLIFSLADMPMTLIEEAFGWLGEKADAMLPSDSVSGVFPRLVYFVTSIVTFALGYWLSATKLTKKSIAVAVAISSVVAMLPMDDARGLAIDGVLGGIGGFVVFLPQICILFFFLALLEDSGYMARGAFVMERWMKPVGLPGKAFVPMLSAHACAIPAIMATRTIESRRDRLVTILVLPLLTCSARLPVYTMIAALLFADRPAMAAGLFAGAYLLGILAAVFSAALLKRTILKGEAEPLVIELPRYRIPSLRNAMFTVLDRAIVFLRQAGTTILLISVVLWAAATYPKLPEAVSASDSVEADENAVLQAQLEYSIAGRTGRLLEPVFDPLGFDWRLNIGVLTSFAAREVLVSTLSVLNGVGEEAEVDRLIDSLRAQKRPDGSPVFTTATSVSLLVFFVIAMQCFPTLVVTRRETGSWNWASLQFVYMTVLAYGCAFIAYRVCLSV